ncbi:HAD-IIA family hydrolase [Thalassobius sp. MITS945101]|uniref:HAD-IIA family hydrolase n=1 Tax=Thalassobius sp. MITS945101 TaxID=3096994 RepID=UPI00399C3C54
MSAKFRTTDYQTAFAGYEAVRHRLPEAGPPRETEVAATLAEVAEHYDSFLLDAFGVLNIGESPVPGAPERLAALRAQGKNLRVLTNAASVPVEDLLAKYHRLGFDFTMDEVISSRQVLLAEAAKHIGMRWGVILPEGAAVTDLAALNFHLLADNPADYDAVDGFLFLGSAGWSDTRQALLCRALVAQPRPLWIGNPDIVAPRENGFSIEPGYFAHQVAEQTGVEPLFFGKPFGNAFDMALATLPQPVDPARVLMVGDSPHTDVLGGNAAGVRSALLTPYGFLAGQDVGAAMLTSGLYPDVLLQAI